MNKLGLHLLRSILAEKIFQKKISSLKKNDDLKFFLKNGFLIKRYKDFNNKNFLLSKKYHLVLRLIKLIGLSQRPI